MHGEKDFYFKMLITFEPKVAQRSVAFLKAPEAPVRGSFLTAFFWHIYSSMDGWMDISQTTTTTRAPAVLIKLLKDKIVTFGGFLPCT